MSQLLMMYLGVFSFPYLLFHQKVRLIFFSFTLLKNQKMVVVLFQHRENIALNLQVTCMLFCYGMTYIKGRQQYNTVVWKVRYFTSNGETQNSKVKVSGAFSSINMLNVTHIFLICSLLSCMLVYNASYSDTFFLYFFLLYFSNFYAYC